MNLLMKMVNGDYIDVAHDLHHQSNVIEKTEACSDGDYACLLDSGWSFYIFGKHGVIPKVGDKLTLWGKGIGYSVRGIAINDVVLYYKTEEEARIKHLKDTYGKSIEDWLKRWDSGYSVWSVSMGGLGPGYEQAIQIMAVEFVRALVATDYKSTGFNDEAAYKSLKEEFYNSYVVEKIQPSGSQIGAAMNIAMVLYRKGPVEALTDEAVKDRLIQVSKYFPQL